MSFTNECRYGRLYSSANPSFNTFGCCSVTGLPSSSSEVLLVRVGTPIPTLPVIANGRKNRISSDRSPNPCPTNNVGVIVLNDSAPTRLAPVLPRSASTPTDRIVSCRSLLKNWYLALRAKLSKPWARAPPLGSSRSQVASAPMPKSLVIRLLKSIEADVSMLDDPSSSVLRLETVGSDSSSATNGSSVASVAGKNRLPAKPWAFAGFVQVAPTAAMTMTAVATGSRIVPKRVATCPMREQRSRAVALGDECFIWLSVKRMNGRHEEIAATDRRKREGSDTTPPNARPAIGRRAVCSVRSLGAQPRDGGPRELAGDQSERSRGRRVAIAAITLRA